MTNQVLITRWLNVFPELAELEPETRDVLLDVIQFERLRRGDVAYYQGQHCRNYLMCIEARRASSDLGVGPGNHALPGGRR
ncbi:hypothetical protein AUC68_11415 [Methyloceanibacter methanicus]|uniref:Cyclic nucleotide-binding domain-containing protein n=1 Tax=Methyloceanibacter methanicus TaxID=1774968 RepID=A0A1E3VX34_9HYPH|nr:hypothetical protein [Methyloceanibacter methanicus]ODR98094.1 hypothetical protein AUC68_11415 [Methyloceanibacter methanicus]